jgi:hypothetical protein
MDSAAEKWRSKTDDELKQNLKFLHSFGAPEVEIIEAEAMRRWGTLTPKDSEMAKPQYCDMCGQLADNDATACSACGNQKLTIISDLHRPWVALTDFQLKQKLLFNRYTQDERTWLVFEAMRRGIIQSTHLPALFDFDFTPRNFDIPFDSMLKLSFKWIMAVAVVSIPIYLVLFLLLKMIG